MTDFDVPYWRAYATSAQEHGSNLCRVLASDLHRLIDQLDAARHDITELRAENARLAQLARSHDRT